VKNQFDDTYDPLSEWKKRKKELYRESQGLGIYNANRLGMMVNDAIRGDTFARLHLRNPLAWDTCSPLSPSFTLPRSPFLNGYSPEPPFGSALRSQLLGPLRYPMPSPFLR